MTTWLLQHTSCCRRHRLPRPLVLHPLVLLLLLKYPSQLFKQVR